MPQSQHTQLGRNGRTPHRAPPSRRGDLDDLDGLRKGAAEADAVIHLAFKHEEMFAGACAAGVVLPPTVHSELDTAGFIPLLVKTARTTGIRTHVRGPHESVAGWEPREPGLLTDLEAGFYFDER